MGRISYEDKMRIQTLHEQGLCAKAIRSRYPAKQWSLNTLKTIWLSPHYQDGIGCDSSVWQRTAKISSNCVCRTSLLSATWSALKRTSQVRAKVPVRLPKRLEWATDPFGASRKWISSCQLFGACQRRFSVDAVKLKRLERCRALLRRLTVNKVKQVFFTDEKNFYLNPPVSKSISNFINFHSSWKFCLHLWCCNRDIHACWVAKSHFKFRQP